jgi:hypothetical protein
LKDELDIAIDRLQQAAETCEHNAAIHDTSGDSEQAALDRKCAESYRAAERHLRAVQG